MFRPNIFTNGHADFFAVDINRLDPAGRLEVTLLVENVVGGQQGLVTFADRLAPLEQSSGVTERFSASLVTINEPDQQRRFSDASVQFLQHRKVLRNEARLENQILRRIPRDRQLRSQHQFRTGGSEALISADDQFAITAQIAHRRVNLSKTNLHAALRQIMRNTAGSNPVLPALSIPWHAEARNRKGGFSPDECLNNLSRRGEENKVPHRSRAD